MKIGIYDPLTVHVLGGAEFAVASLADGLRREHTVEIVTHCPTMTVAEVAEFSGYDLTGVGMRYVPFSRDPYSEDGNLWRRYRHERNWQATLSEPYDLFVNFAHWIPPFCHASVGVLIVMFPLFIPPDRVVHEPDTARPRPPIQKWVREQYYGWQWRRRLGSYRVKLAISHFTQTWTRNWWKVSCPVLYPPVAWSERTRAGALDAVRRLEYVEPGDAAAVKHKTILSVGRYTPSHTIDSKKQLELTNAFMEMNEGVRTGWQFCCAGRVSDVPADREYYEAVHRAGDDSAIALADVTREELNRLLGRAAIFWHATGLGTDPLKEPHASEHFGISTVEAMASGCVPVVINRGGMTELVQHGVNGFLWNDLSELKDFTTLLIHNEPLRRQLSEAARVRGQQFSQARFLHGFRQHVRPFAPQLAPAAAGQR